MTVLVVGATGELGSAVVRALAVDDENVRAFVRPTSDYEGLTDLGVEFAFGDLRDPGSVERACDGVDVVVATANAVAPRLGDTFADVGDAGYRTLIDAAAESGVRQFVYLSVPETPYDDRVPAFRIKRLNERRLRESGMAYTVVRSSLFMDSWLALIGSSVPTRGSEAATLNRPYRFLQTFRRATGRLIEDRGIALIPGSEPTRHSFIALDDVATFVAACVDDPGAENRVYEIGGPEALSWDEVVERYERVLGRDVRAVHTPTAVYALQQRLLSPISTAAANIMGMNRIVATTDSTYDSDEAEAMIGRPLVTVEEFLRRKVEL